MQQEAAEVFVSSLVHPAAASDYSVVTERNIPDVMSQAANA